jgi:DNA-binding CsgD family transcriptional regulator
MDEPFENKELSEREIEVVRLLAAGLSNKEIAGELYLSVNTVKVHLRNVFAKLGVQSRTEATLIAIQRGWVSVPQRPGDGQPAVAAPIAPIDIPRIVIEPPLPMWRRVALVIMTIVVAIGVFVSGAQATNGAPTSIDIGTDRPGGDALPLAAGDTAWAVAASMPTARTRLAVAAHAGRLVAIGGDTQGGATNAVEWFDPESNTWSGGAPKPTAVFNVSAATLGDKIYVPGGLIAAGVPTTTVEVYDAVDDAWSSVASLPAPRMAYAAAAFDGQVYIFGGWDGSTYSARTFVYYPGSDEWSNRASMSAPRGFAAAAALNDAIYVVGGFDGQIESSLCERYLPRDDRWESCPSMSVGRGGLALVRVGASLYAIGGGWTGYLAFNESYAAGADAWRAIPTPFVEQWRGLGAVEIDAEIFAVGGWSGQYLAVTEHYSPFPFKVFVPAAQGEETP